MSSDADVLLGRAVFDLETATAREIRDEDIYPGPA